MKLFLAFVHFLVVFVLFTMCADIAFQTKSKEKADKASPVLKECFTLTQTQLLYKFDGYRATSI